MDPSAKDHEAARVKRKRRPPRAVSWVELTPRPNQARRLREISRRTGLLPDEVASHLIEAAAGSLASGAVKPLKEAGPAQPNEQAQEPPSKLMLIGLTARANRWLYRKALQDGFGSKRKGRNRMAALVLERTALELPVFEAAAAGLETLHQQRLRDLDADRSAPIRERRSRGLASQQPRAGKA